MQIIDAVPSTFLHKLLLVEDKGRFSIVEQANLRSPPADAPKLSWGEALQAWRPKVYQAFMGVTHNERDSRLLTERRLNRIQ